MSKENNYPNQWPKAFVVVFGTAAIGATAFFTKEPLVMWAILPLLWAIDSFD
jgi:hypothetical protein